MSIDQYEEGATIGPTDRRPPRAPSRKSPSEIREVLSLTGLRGVAACWVALYHICNHEAGRGFAKTMLEHGYLAVDMFFCLSGFVMAMTASAPFRTGFSARAYGSFMWRRFARIWPLYAVLTLVVAAIGLGLGIHEVSSDYWFTLATNLLMVQTFGLSNSILAQGWSVSVEIGAYVAFPLLLTVTVFARPWLAGLTLMAVVATLAALVLLPSELSGVVRYRGPLDMTSSFNYSTTARCLLEFSLGLLAYRASRNRSVLSFFDIDAIAIAVCAMLLGLLAVENSDLVVALLFPALLLTLYSDKTWIARALASRVLYWLGVISYSLYLTHTFGVKLAPVATRFLMQHGVSGAWILSVVLASAASLVLAVLCHYLVERPSRAFLRHLTGGMRVTLWANRLPGTSRS